MSGILQAMPLRSKALNGQGSDPESLLQVTKGFGDHSVSGGLHPKAACPLPGFPSFLSWLLWVDSPSAGQ